GIIRIADRVGTARLVVNHDGIYANITLARPYDNQRSLFEKLNYIPSCGGYALDNGVASQVRIMSIYIDEGIINE
ncbi:MAG: hypothetical protein WCQ26_13680, partial [Pseudanabaena sp. ELA748]